MSPKYTITEKILSYTAEIAELIGSIKVTAELDKNPVLRRKKQDSDDLRFAGNRAKTR